MRTLGSRFKVQSSRFKAQGSKLKVQGLRKVRMAIKSKGRGKSHGARVITYLRSWELNYELKKCYLCTHKDHGLYSTQHTLCRVAMPGFFFDFEPTAKNQ